MLMRLSVLALCAMLVGAAGANAAPAEKDKTPTTVSPRPVKKAPAIALPPVRDLQRKQAPPLDVEMFTARGERLTHTARVVHRGPRKAALQAFELRFENGDHKIQKIGLLNSGTQIDASFNDEDGDDPFSFRGRYVHIIGFDDRVRYETVVEENCQERCTLRLPELADGETALLVGFLLERKGADDYNVRGVGIVLLPDREAADVVFYDDRGADFGFFPAPFLPAEYQFIDRGINVSRRGVYVKLQLLIVPENLIESAGRMIGGTRADAMRAPELVRTKHWSDLSYQHALMGFGVSFGNEDHFLEAFAIDVHGRPTVKFQDSDTDDPISWFIDYATFKRKQPLD